MLNSTRQLKNIVSQKCGMEEIQNFYKGQECYILLTGPSFNDYSTSELREQLKDKLVFCVKQSIEGLEDIADFHFWNCSNFPVGSQGEPYKYNMFQRPIVVASSNFPLGYRWSVSQVIDFFVKVPLIEEFGKDNCVVFKKNYDDFLFSKSISRPVGPGIMLETILYFAVHLGVSKIKTLGWDLNAHGSHFYNSEVDNKGCEIPWDIKANAESVPSIVEWLNSYKIKLQTISKSSTISESVKRVNLS